MRCEELKTLGINGEGTQLLIDMLKLKLYNWAIDCYWVQLNIVLFPSNFALTDREREQLDLDIETNPMESSFSKEVSAMMQQEERLSVQVHRRQRET